MRYTQSSVWTDGSCPTGAQKYLEERWAQEARRALAGVSQHRLSGLKKAKVPQMSHTDPLQIRTPEGDHGDKTQGRSGQPVEWEVGNDETRPGRALARLNQAGTLRRAPS